MALVRDLRWGGLEARVLDMTFEIAAGDLGMEGALDRLLRRRLAGDPRGRLDPRPLATAR